MSKRRLSAAALVAAFLLIFVPAPSQAASRMWTLLPDPSAGLFARIERWWNHLLNGAEHPARPEPSIPGQKNGCGIDPNGGENVCGPGGGGANATVEPAGSDEG